MAACPGALCRDPEDLPNTYYGNCLNILAKIKCEPRSGSGGMVIFYDSETSVLFFFAGVCR